MKEDQRILVFGYHEIPWEKHKGIRAMFSKKRGIIGGEGCTNMWHTSLKHVKVVECTQMCITWMNFTQLTLWLFISNGWWTW